MPSPTTALAWEIWSRNRTAIQAIVLMTAVGLTQPRGGDPSPFVELLGIVSFVLLFAVFNDAEFPTKRFTLPVSSLRLVAVPVLLGVGSVELLYVLWMGRLGGGGSTGSLLVAVLLAAYMLCFQAATWTFAPFGPLRLAIVGALGLVFIVVGFLSSNERATTVAMVGLGAVVFYGAWTFVARARSGGGKWAGLRASSIDVPTFGWPRRAVTFASPSAARAWLEWRRGAVTLPMLVGGLLLLAAPYSWWVRADPAGTLRLLMAIAALPIVVAVPVGVAFSKPTFWSEDLAVPSFLAVQPLGSDDWIAIKLKVSARAAAVAWVFVLAFLGVWLALLAPGAAVGQLCKRPGTCALLLVAAMFVTWRVLVIRLWSGLSGSRRLYFASGLAAVFGPIAAVLFESEIRWVFEDERRATAICWLAAIALAIKYAAAARLWIRVGRSRVRGMVLLVWLGGSIYFVGLSLWLAGDRRWILPALLLVPIVRLLAAPLLLARNRHQ